MKKILIICIPIIMILGSIIILRTYPYRIKDKNRLIDICLEKKKANIFDYIRLDMNHDFKLTLYDMILVQKKINERVK